MAAEIVDHDFGLQPPPDIATFSTATRAACDCRNCTVRSAAADISGAVALHQELIAKSVQHPQHEEIGRHERVPRTPSRAVRRAPA